MKFKYFAIIVCVMLAFLQIAMGSMDGFSTWMAAGYVINACADD